MKWEQKCLSTSYINRWKCKECDGMNEMNGINHTNWPSPKLSKALAMSGRQLIDIDK